MQIQSIHIDTSSQMQCKQRHTHAASECSSVRMTIQPLSLTHQTQPAIVRILARLIELTRLDIVSVPIDGPNWIASDDCKLQITNVDTSAVLVSNAMYVEFNKMQSQIVAQKDSLANFVNHL